ncbi:MAG TPA: cytochrome P450 [Terriglobales bacterium]|nr:cytochrome P450 [Terriglobales bacterium]
MPKQEFPPGPPSSRWRGSFFQYTRDPLTFLPEAIRTYGDVIGLRFLKFRIYFLNHPDMIEELLVAQARKFGKGRVLKANQRLFGKGLLTSEGDFWLRQRRLAQPAFHRARIASYAEAMVQYAEKLTTTWKHGEERDIHAEMMALTLQIVGKTLFGVEVTGEVQEVGHSLEALMELNSDIRRLMLVPGWLPTLTNIRAGLAIRRLDRMIYRIIREGRTSGEDRGDLLSLLLRAQDDDGSHMSDVQLRDEALTIFLAGHETTAVALSWTWWLLDQHPEIEAKLHAELNLVLQGRTPTLEDLPGLRYTEHVITESMRLYPPAWGMARMALEDTELAGYRVRKGSGVTVAQWAVHRDARWYQEPLAFRPERWQGDLAKRIPRFAYFPFGGGPRQCIGNAFALMETTLVLATIAQQFRFRIVPQHPVVPIASITLRPRYGIRVVLEKRG